MYNTQERARNTERAMVFQVDASDCHLTRVRVLGQIVRADYSQAF